MRYRGDFLDSEKIGEMIKQYGYKVDEFLPKFLEKNNNHIWNKFLNEPIWYHMSTGGKRIRPALCLLTTELLGEDIKKAMNFALAVEIMHNYLLLHDDVMDGDKFRRDKPTVWVKYGIPNAVNSGDYMIAKAYEIILKSDLPIETIKKLEEAFTLTLLRTGEGQALDVNLRADEHFTEEKYMELAKGKTGHYLVCPIVGGAIIAGASQEVIDELWKLGGNIGTAFQIRDDIIDLTEGKGRPPGCDIREGKPGILYAHALRNANPEEKKKLVEIMKKPRDETTDEDIQWVKKLYEKYGTIEYAQKKAEELKKEAMRILDELPFSKKDVVKQIAEYVISRKT